MKDIESAGLLQELSELLGHSVPSHNDLITNPSTFTNFLSMIKEHMHKLVKEKDEFQKSFSVEQAARIANEQAVRVLESKYKRHEEELVHTKELLTSLKSRGPDSKGTQEDVTSHGDKVKKLNDRIAELEGELGDYIKVVERKQNEIDSLNSQLEGQSNRLRDLRELNAKSGDTTLELQSKLAQAQVYKPTQHLFF